MPHTSKLKQAFIRNDEWNLDKNNPAHYNPEHHKKMRKLIYNVNGDWTKVIAEDKEDWELEFFDYWQMCEEFKDRRTPEQVAADKAKASAIDNPPPSMQGNVRYPTRFIIFKGAKQMKTSPFFNKHIHFLFLRFSGGFIQSNVPSAKISAANQLADFQQASGQHLPRGSWELEIFSFSNSHLSRPDIETSGHFKTTIGRLSTIGASLHFFVLGLEGFFGMRSALQELYDTIRQFDPTTARSQADQATITFSLQDIEADLYTGPHTDFVRITDGEEQRRCISFSLQDILTANNNPKVDWLRVQLKQRTDGRAALFHGTVYEHHRQRIAASLGVRRHRRYGNMLGNPEPADDGTG